MALTEEQIALLRQPLDPHLASRMSPDGKGKVSYIEAFVVIEQANRIFGHGRWGYELLREERDVDPDTGAGVYSAWVRVSVADCEPVVELGDCILSVGQGRKANSAQKSMARKGAVTDGMKRGLRHFGDQMGNSLYDKDSDIHRQIDAAEREEQAGQRHPAPRPTAPPARTAATPAGGATTPPQGCAEGVGKAADAGGRARKLYDAVAAAMRDDAPMAEALAAKGRTLDNLTVEELQQTLAALRSRAAKRAQQAADAPTATPTPSEAPDYGPSYDVLYAVIAEATDAGELFKRRREVADARDSKHITNDGYTALMKLLNSREAKMGKPLAVH